MTALNATQKAELHATNAEKAADNAEAANASMDDLCGTDDYQAGLALAQEASRAADQASQILYYSLEKGTDGPIARRICQAAARAAKAAKGCWGIIEANAEALDTHYEPEDPAPNQGDWS